MELDRFKGHLKLLVLVSSLDSGAVAGMVAVLFQVVEVMMSCFLGKPC